MAPDRRFAEECQPNGWHSLVPAGAQPSHPTGIVVDNAQIRVGKRTPAMSKKAPLMLHSGNMKSGACET
jgi:hypothetical protein